MTEPQTLEQQARLTDDEMLLAWGYSVDFVPDDVRAMFNAATRKALAVGEAERKRLEEAATDWRLAQYETARQRQRLQERMREMKVLLGDAISLLTEFASGYLSPDGKTVIEERGSMGHDLSELWRKVVLLEQGEEKP